MSVSTRFMLAEDNHINQEVLVELLTEVGLKVGVINIAENYRESDGE
jgi:CheY-like chemotaxis protein